MGVIIGGFFVFVSVMMARDRISEIHRGWDSADWPTVRGVVLESQVVRRGGSGRRGASSRLVFRYRYEVAGAVYSARRVAFTAIGIGRVPNAYPEGAAVTVQYDPADPAVSVLEPGVTLRAATVSLAPFLLFAALGIALGAWSIRAARRG